MFTSLDVDRWADFSMYLKPLSHLGHLVLILALFHLTNLSQSKFGPLSLNFFIFTITSGLLEGLLKIAHVNVYRKSHTKENKTCQLTASTESH
jgi:hypothetical protein